MPIFDFTEDNAKLSIKDYHARPELSKSSLDLLAKSPYHLKNKELFRVESPSLNLGSATHGLVLEPDLFNEEFAVSEKFNKRTTIGKEAHKAFELQNQGKIILDEGTFAIAKNMSENVLKLGKCFLSNGIAESSFFGELEGVKVRCRPDYYIEELGIVVDLKTAQDASNHGFMQSVAKYNYHVQAAFYLDTLRSIGKNAKKFLFIAVESKAPFMVAFYELDHAAIDQGVKRYKELLERYKYCQRTNNWSGYADFDKQNEKVSLVQTLTLPAWKFYE